MKTNENYGNIKVYGKVIDLDNTPIEDLIEMKAVLDNRLKILVNKYFEINEQNV